MRRAASASGPVTSSSGIATGARSPSGSRFACKYPQRRNASQTCSLSFGADESTIACCLLMNLPDLMNLVCCLLPLYRLLRPGGEGCGSAFAPRTEHPPNQDELAQMVGVVVREKQRLAKYRLARAMRNRREQICLRISDEFRHRFQVRLECLDALVPRRVIRRR